MNSQSIQIFEFPNGLTLLVEEMRHVQSASFSMMVPSGAIYEPAGKNGTAAALCDMMTRGSGTRDSRQMSSALDNLGVQRNENVGWNFVSFSGATLAVNLLPVIPLYADIIRRPLLPESQFPAVMSGIEQSLLAEEDEPQRRALVELRKHCYDSPWNRPNDGSLEELEQITLSGVQDFYQTSVRPNGTLIGVAGNVDALEVRDAIERAFGDWEAKPEQSIIRTSGSHKNLHIPHESAQTHIALAYQAVPYGDPDYYAAWAAVGILSGGSSSRLFTEVREKRGLCYSVYATLSTLLTEGRVLAYAGTTTERAQETLDVMLGELLRLPEGIDEAELTRCKARAKSAMIMQQESTSARASAIARDWFHLKRVNTLEDVHNAVDGLTVEQILDFACRYPARDFTFLTIGEKPLNFPGS
ncbi:M16 family metallopeptidase [Planctomicrobium sp. SH668]|uniref:M16 family metallopeptidase n=1 Tax=Planctomicrobium sp. SH668 TaxID=3448126 RepID=UPI003F5B1FA8